MALHLKKKKKDIRLRIPEPMPFAQLASVIAKPIPAYCIPLFTKMHGLCDLLT
jgi:hypothetical protein